MRARLEMAIWPDQMIEEVVRHIVDITDIVRFSLVSKSWYSYLHSKFYWESRSVITCSITGIFGGYGYGYPRFEGYGYPRFGLGVSTLPSLHSWSLEKWPHSDHISPFLSVSQSHDHLCSVDWKKWPHSDQISPFLRVSHSHGLCCSVAGVQENGVYVYDPFTYRTRNLICPDLNFEWSSIRDVCFYVDLSTHNYVVMLFVQLGGPYLVIYEARTDSWRKSQSLLGCASYLERRCMPICVGDSIDSLSVYFSDNAEKIYKYNFATDSWSEKPFAMAPLSQGEVENLILIQSDGKLMFVGKQSDEICVWLASEDDKSYSCTMLASITITIEEDWFVADADSAQDLICIHCEINTGYAWLDIGEDHESHEADLITVYSPSTNRWQFLDCPTLGNELRPFYADVRQLFVLEPRLDVRRLLMTN